MARPIPLEIPPRDPHRELRARLENAPLEHAEALLSLYDLVQDMHDRGILDILRGGLGASDKIIETAVEAAKTPDTIRGIRNLIYWRRILGSIEPEWFRSLFQAIPEGISQATAERDRPTGLFKLLWRMRSKESLRGLAAAVDFLESFGRHLPSAENPSKAN